MKTPELNQLAKEVFDTYVRVLSRPRWKCSFEKPEASLFNGKCNRMNVHFSHSDNLFIMSVVNSKNTICVSVSIRKDSVGNNIPGLDPRFYNHTFSKRKMQPIRKQALILAHKIDS